MATESGFRTEKTENVADASTAPLWGRPHRHSERNKNASVRRAGNSGFLTARNLPVSVTDTSSLSTRVRRRIRTPGVRADDLRDRSTTRSDSGRRESRTSAVDAGFPDRRTSIRTRQLDPSTFASNPADATDPKPRHRSGSVAGATSSTNQTRDPIRVRPGPPHEPARPIDPSRNTVLPADSRPTGRPCDSQSS